MLGCGSFAALLPAAQAETVQSKTVQSRPVQAEVVQSRTDRTPGATHVRKALAALQPTVRPVDSRGTCQIGDESVDYALAGDADFTDDSIRLTLDDLGLDTGTLRPGSIVASLDLAVDDRLLTVTGARDYDSPQAADGSLPMPVVGGFWPGGTPRGAVQVVGLDLTLTSSVPPVTTQRIDCFPAVVDEPAVPGVPSDPGAIAGTVSTPAPVAPSDTYVVVLRYDEAEDGWNRVGSVSPETSGKYSVTGLAPGEYRVEFASSDDVVVREYYQDVTEFDDASALHVEPGETITDVDATLVRAGSIGGRVTVPAGHDPTDVRAQVFAQRDGAWVSVGYALAESDGAYRVTGLAPGTYRVGFTDHAGRLLDTFHASVDTVEAAKDITVGAGAAVANINATLAVAGSVSGRLTGAQGPMVGATVVAYRDDDDDEWWDAISVARSDAEGRYRVEGLTQGTYRLGFLEPSGLSAVEFYEDAPTVWEAKDVPVGRSQAVTGIDAELVQAGAISGAVTPATDAEVVVVAYAQTDGEWREIRRTLAVGGGFYKFDQLEAGAYRIGFEPQDDDYLDEFHADAATLAAATDVRVTPGRTTAGIDAALTLGGSVAGRLTVPAGTDMETLTVSVRHYVAHTDRPGGYWWEVASGPVDASGNYRVGGLRSGVHRVGFSDWKGLLVPSFHRGARTIETATDVPVTLGRQTGGIDGTLVAYASLAGTVSGPAGVDVSGVEVRLHPAGQALPEDDSWYRTARTDAAGRYEITNVEAGSYVLEFFSNGTLVSEFHADAADRASAAVVTLTPGQRRSIDAALDTGSTVTGRLKAPAGVELGSVFVTAYERETYAGRATWVEAGMVRAGADGRYAIAGLGAGSYRLGFRDFNDVLSQEFYDDAVTLDAADDVKVASRTTVPGIDADLAVGATISGKATAPASAGVDELTVQAFRRDGDRWVVAATDWTDGDGAYTLTGLTPGSYRIGFSHWDGKVADEYYDDVATIEKAKDLQVGREQKLTGIDAALTVEGPKAPPAPPKPPVPAPKVIKLVKAPRVTGVAKVGKTLKVSRGTWKPGTVTLKYQWFVKRGGKFVLIKKATKARLKLVRSLRGTKVRVRVTVNAPGHRSLVHTSKVSVKIRK